MAERRKYQDGENDLGNGYVLHVLRYVSPYQSSDKGRIAGKYFGYIQEPDGTLVMLGEQGKNTKDLAKLIKNVCNIEVEVRERSNSGETAEIRKLEELKSDLMALGISTADIDAKIEELKHAQSLKAIIAERRAEVAELNRRKKSLHKIYDQMNDLGLDATEVGEEIARINNTIDELLTL